MSLRATSPTSGMVTRLKKAQPGELCSIIQSEGRFDADDTYDLAEQVFKNRDIDSLEVLRCFNETMKLPLDDVRGPDGEPLLFPAVENGQLESVKHLT